VLRSPALGLPDVSVPALLETDVRAPLANLFGHESF
jgi:hypothetical protein